MANHDFNSPCDCSECRTTMFEVTCPSCEFETTVSYIRSHGESIIDRKGIRGFSYIENNEKGHNLDCFKCNFHILDVSTE